MQRWAWFSLDHVLTDSAGVTHWGINPYASLLDAGTGDLRRAGEIFREYALGYPEELGRINGQ